MDNLLQEDATYLLQEDQENIFLEAAQPVMINGYQFFSSSAGNTGIISVTEKIR